MNVTKLSHRVVADLVDFVVDNNLAHGEPAATVIGRMSEREAFDAFLSWNGIIGYAETITDALDSIREAAADTPLQVKVGDKVQFTREYLRSMTQVRLCAVMARGVVAKVVHVTRTTHTGAVRLSWPDGSESGSLVEHLERAHG